MASGLPNFRPGDPQWRPIWVVICLMFVSLSGVLFVYLRSVNPGIPDLTFARDCRETFLLMDAIALFMFFLATFVNPTVNKVNPRNYASMADTEALIENIGPVYPRPLF